MKYLNVAITLKDMFTGTLNNIIKKQDTFKKETSGIKQVLDKSYKINNKDLQNALKDISTSIKKNKEDLKNAQASMEGWKKLIDTSSVSVKKLSKDVQELSLKKQKLISEMDKLKTSGNTEVFSNYENALKQVDSSLKEKTSSLGKARAENKKYSKELLDSQKEVSKLDVSLDSLKKKYDELSRKKTKKSGIKDTLSLKKQSNNINNLYEKFDANKNKYSGFEKLGGSIKNVGKSMSLGLSTPITIGLGASLKTGINFESALSSVEATLGSKATAEGMDLLKQKAMEMGRNTTKSATESANAMEYMSLAGWDTQQIIGGIEPILRLSEAGKSDLATTSDLVTDSMSALGLKVGELGGFLDKVAKTSTSSNTSIIQMMEAFIVAGGKVRSLGGDISEFSGILGVMASRGLKGSDAGRGLSAILTNLTSPTGQAQKALNELNFSAFDSQGNFIGLEKTFYKLKDSLKGMTQEQRNTYLSMIAGKEHGKTMEAIMSGLSEEYQDLTNDIRNSNGALETMAKTMQDNTQGKIENLKAKLEDLGIKVSEHILPAFSTVIEFISNMIEKFSNLSPKTQTNIIMFGVMAVILPPVIATVGTLINSIGLLSSAFTLISANPVTLIILALLGLGIGLVWLYNKFEWFRDGVNNVWQWIVEKAEWAVNSIIDCYNRIVGIINKIPGVNIKTVGEVTWSDKKKASKVKKFEESGEALKVSKDNPLLAKGYNAPLIDGSYKTGLDFVPYDGFIAELHKGERVLTAEENKAYNTKYLERGNKNSNNTIVSKIFRSDSANNSQINNINKNNSSSNNQSNIIVNVNVNYNGKESKDINLNNMANEVANIIANKIRMAKINVV